MRKSFVLALFFISGLAGLVHELVWLRLFSLTFGNTTQAGAVVIAAFMGGLALGAWYAGRKMSKVTKPIRLYAWIEFGVAAGAILLLFGYWAADSVYTTVFAWTGPGSFILTILRIVISFALMLLPCALMGATLPVLVKGAVTKPEQSGQKAGALYALNTFGAVAGVLLTGFFAIKALGVYQTAVFAIVLNALVGIFAWKLSSGETVTEDKRATQRKTGKKKSNEDDLGSKWALILAGAAGFAALSMEVMYSRLAVFAVSNTIYVWTIVLAVFLSGIAIGSIFTARKSSASQAPAATAAKLLIWMSAGMWLSLIGLSQRQSLSKLFGVFFSGEGGWGEVLTFKALLVASTLILPALFSGLAFPYLVRGFVGTSGLAGDKVGRLYAVNTSAGIAGSLISAFIVIPIAGAQRGIFWFALLLFIIAVYALGKLAPKVKDRAIPTTIGIIIALGALILPGGNLAVNLLKESRPQGKVLMVEDGLNATVVVYQIGGFREIDINGIQTAGTDPLMRTTQILQGHVPMMMHPAPKKVLMVGFGSGETARICTMYGIDKIDVVELSTAVLEAAPLFRETNTGIYDDPKLSAIVGDGKNYLKLTKEKYDVIMNDSIHPAYLGNAGLYSVDYFESARKRLNPGGVMTSWIPLFDLNEDAFKMMVNSFATVFPNSAVLYAHTGLNRHALLVARNGDGSLLDVERVRSSLKKENVAQSLGVMGVDDPLDIVNFMIMGKNGLNKYLKDAGLHTDNHPNLEFEAPKSAPGPEDWQPNLKGLLAVKEDPLPYIDIAGLSDPEQFKTEHESRRKAAGMVASTIAGGNLDPAYLHKKLTAAKNMSVGVAGVDQLMKMISAYAEHLANTKVPGPGGAMALAAAQLKVGNLDQAIDILEEEIVNSPDNFQAHLMLGKAWSDKGDEDRSMQAYERALAIKPENRIALSELGVAYFRQSKYMEAVEYFSKADKAGEPDATLLWRLGLAFEKDGQPAKAEQAYQRAISADPKFAKAYTGYGNLLIRYGRGTEARVNFQKAVELNPSDKVAVGNLGMIFLKEKNLEMARQMFEKVLQIDPDDQMAKGMLSQIPPAQ